MGQAINSSWPLDSGGHCLSLGSILGNSRECLEAIGQSSLPASFVYGGRNSRELLATWPRACKPPVETERGIIREITWSERNSGFVAAWHVEIFKDRPAIEFRWIFENQGATPSRPISDVQALDLRFCDAGQTSLMHSTGGLSGPLNGEAAAFLVRESNLKSPLALSAHAGRSSNKDLPFFVLHDPASAGGLYAGIGWSGQWQADFQPDAAGQSLRITAGMPGMNLALPAGERIISPSILLGAYRGNAQDGCNALRRVLGRHYVARLDGRRMTAPVSWNSWFTFANNISDTMLRQQMDAAAGLGLEYFCIDAGWFTGAFDRGVGNWTIDRNKFPDGLRPIGRYAEKNGMKLGLWFEPGRAMPGTRLAVEHPEWVALNQVKLEIPAACDWLFDAMCAMIDEANAAWIRYDYNQGYFPPDPLTSWNARDTAQTAGLTQIKYLQGEYALLDRLRAKYPGMVIESCASGGRRIDIETMRRAHTYWKSDETNSLPVARSQATGGNCFLPGSLLNTNLPGASSASTFDLRSLFAGPLGFATDWTRLDEAGRARVRLEIAAFKRVRYLLDQDYYPLFTQTFDLAQWCGWQFNDPETGEGFFVALRPAESPCAEASLRLHGVMADKAYHISRIDGSQPRRVAGSELRAGLATKLHPGEAEVWSYRLAR